MPPSKALCLVTFLGFLLGMTTRSATGVITAHGEFVAADQCSAPLTLPQSNPDETQLEPGRTYRALGLNRRGGDWIRIIVPEARPRVRWADLSCGEFRVDEGTLHFSPFFDQRNNAVYVDYPRRQRQDITPLPPTLTTVEERILALCGYPGDYPEPGAFRSLIEAHPSLLDNLTAALGCNNTKDPDCQHNTVLDQITDLWFIADGFRRIFCGEFGPKRMDGPHYRGAYLQLQQRGWGGLMAPHQGREEIVSGAIYSIGVEHEWRGRRVKTSVSPGYFYTLDGPELLIHGTRAITLLGAPSVRQGCRYTLTTNTNNGTNSKITFNSVIIGKDGGIKTFYPTALPDRTLHPCE